jgi:hypothetical protein
VEELLEVRVLRILRGLDAEGRVTARAGIAGHVVLHLGLQRQREELAEHAVGSLDRLAVDAMVADPAEAPFAVGGAELGDESLAIGVEAADVQGRDTAAHVILVPK